jgi:small subunit ribosomal protein S7
MRRRQAEKREILPDPKFGDVLATKFMNRLMVDGKRSAAEKIFYSTMDDLAAKLKRPAMEVFHEVLDKVRPDIEVRSRRVGGATYQVPVEVRGERQTALAMRWLVSFARKRSEKTMHERLMNEMMDALNDRGGSVKKREDTHKMAEANRAFAHYRW